MVFEKLFGSDGSDDSDDPEEGVVWANFSRKYETWHFGPNDDKDVVYDGIEKDVLYRFVDDEDNSRVTSYNRQLKCSYEAELFTGEIDEEWREKRREDKEMYLVAQGSWDGKNLRYNSPVLVVEKPVFDELRNEANIAYVRSMDASPRRLHQNVRNR